MSEEISVVVNAALKGKQYTAIKIHKDAPVDELLEKICEWRGLRKDSFSVLFTSLMLQSVKDGKTKYLSDYKIIDRSELYVVHNLYGGSEQGTNEGLKQLGDGVELTNEPDMITWDDDPDHKRAKMPCGHAMGPESLTAYCRSLLTANKYQFFCPYQKNNIRCGAQWEYYVIRELGVLTDDEKKEFETKLGQNYMRKALGIQECPSCNVFCRRKNKSDRRVICPSCSEDGTLYEFCWYCLGVWKTSGTENCGNSTCAGKDPRLKILKNAGLKTIVGLDGCPSIRACPSCGALIHHERECKHMTCICEEGFCFICLEVPKAAGSYSCGSYNTHCKIAPVQTTIPGD